MRDELSILFLGDIVGRIGRRALAQILPALRKEKDIGLVVANGENLAHGFGVTPATAAEAFEVGVDFLTTGNHISSKESFKELVEADDYKVIRPANFPPLVPGRGYKILEVGKNQVAIVNLMGRIYFRQTLDDPFRKLDEILAELKEQGVDKKSPIIIDWHTEATSEKIALGWYADGRVAAVIGTHTHVPTADARILPKGTAFVSDVGMVGARDSSLGVEKEGPLETMLTQMPRHFEVPETGVVQLNSVLLTIDRASGLAKKIERLDKEVTINE